jgi:SAM-dependent methyltransferase
MASRIPQPIQFDSVADIYDAYVQTDFDIPFWLSEARAVNGKVLELTCGTGRVSIPLLRAGINLTCVDYAPEMLARFRRKLDDSHLSCRLVLQDISNLRLTDRYDLIFIPFHSFSELTHEEKRRSTLERIRDHLTDQGVFICTLQNPAVRISSMDGTARLIGEFSLPNSEKLVVSSRLSFDSSSQLAQGVQVYDRYTSSGSIIDHRTLEVSFYLFHKDEFEALVHHIGFEVAALYGDYNYKPYVKQSSEFMIWKLRRSETGV